MSIVRKALVPVLRETIRRPLSPAFVHCCRTENAGTRQVDVAVAQPLQLATANGDRDP